MTGIIKEIVEALFGACDVIEASRDFAEIFKGYEQVAHFAKELDKRKMLIAVARSVVDQAAALNFYLVSGTSRNALAAAAPREENSFQLVQRQGGHELRRQRRYQCQ